MSNAFPNKGINVIAGNGTGGESNRVCVHYESNSVTSPGIHYFVEQWAGTTFQIEDLSPAAGASVAQIKTHIASENTGAVSGDVDVSPAGFGVVVTYTDAACATVP